MYRGIDVSKHNGIINYDIIKNNTDIQMIIARCGYGQWSKQKDEMFERNYSESARLGFIKSTYLYSYALDVEGAKREARNCLFFIEGKQFEGPVFFDIEDPSQNNLSKQMITDMCIAFCEIIKAKGYKVGVYTSKSWITNKIEVNKLPGDYYIWVATYGKNTGDVPSDIYKYKGKQDIWQYTSKGYVDRDRRFCRH